MSGALQAVFQNLRSFITVPGAPTIGTATATGTTTATVVFTAPASNGGAVITSYTATSSPGGVTGTLSQAGSGTITVSGLTPLTVYTFTVTATNAIGTGPASAASNSTTTTAPAIGAAAGGGYYAGQIAVNGGGTATHYLIVSEASVGQASKTWQTTGAQVVTGFNSVINGPANTSGLAALGSNYQAATFCENLNTGGYTDWYLPAKNELEVCYYFLKPDTVSNNTSSGSNANAVSPEPISTNYTTSSPARTTVSAFQAGNGQDFPGGPPTGYFCLTSTENGSNYAIKQNFAYGYRGLQDNVGKENGNGFVRAVRRVPV